MEVTVQVSEVELIREIAGDVKREIQDRLDDAVRGAIKGALDEQLLALTIEKLRPLIDEIVAEGWQKTNDYGDPVGPRVGLKERISEQLQKTDSWGSREPWVTKFVREAIEKELHGELGQELKKAKETIRSTVTGLVQQKLNETLAEALGLRLAR